MNPSSTATGSQRDATQPDNSNDPDPVSSSRRDSMSQISEDSQTAADFIRDQMQLEADAREALPYSFKNCTGPLGSLRQNIYACLTCNPPPADSSGSFSAAGICYSCSVQCHGEHELVEIFQKRNFTCDCGTTRFRPDQPCTLRINPDTGTRGNVHSELPDPNNKYNQNFRNRFCSCSIDYSPQDQKGTMFQCLGLGTHETGGCGEDWYHPGCLVGQGPKWYDKLPKRDLTTNASNGAALTPIFEDPTQETVNQQQTVEPGIVEDDDEDVPLPDGFPEEEDFDFLLCYKCVETHPWIKRYAGTPGFLPPVFLRMSDDGVGEPPASKKRKLEDEEDSATNTDSEPSKRIKSDINVGGESNMLDPAASNDVPMKAKVEDMGDAAQSRTPKCKLTSLPPAPNGIFSIPLKADFRDHLCHCPSCFPNLTPHPQLLEQEEEYEPPLSEASGDGSTHGSGSLYDRGESALKNVDRVRAIEGVMAYNNLKEKLKPFFQEFADSGKAIGAEDIKNYFAKLRGDEQAIREAGETAKEDHRREQSGY